jgi:hypothetical protein
MRCAGRQADDRLLRWQFAIIIAPGNLRPYRGQNFGEVDDESWRGLSAGRTWR